MYSIIKSGMASAMHELSVISNNVSNANSNGFKKSLVSFADFAGGLFPASVQSSANGLGSRVEETRVSDAQGAILSTENKTDMALIGNGYFALQNLNDNSISFTRNGAFGLDEQGFLTTADNHRVLGTPIFENDFGQTPDNIEALQPIQIPSLKMTWLCQNWRSLKMVVFLQGMENKIPVPISSLTIGIFSNPIGLKELGNARFSATERSGLLTLGAPMDSGFADLQVGVLKSRM